VGWTPPIDGKRNFSLITPTYTLPGAMVFDPADGFWRLGVRLILSKNTFPERRLFFVLAITERGGKTILLAPSDGQERELDPNDPEQMDVLAESIADSIKRTLDAEPLAYLKSESSKKEIGFHVSIGLPATPTLVNDL
jgi:hypothetical protein